VLEGYMLILKELDKMPDHMVDCLTTIYEWTNHYYHEEDDPSSSVRIKKILPIINIIFMRFLFSPEVIDIKVYKSGQKTNTKNGLSAKDTVLMQAVQWMSKSYTNITFGKVFKEGTEYGLHLINQDILNL
jgi:hypothetical protein